MKTKHSPTTFIQFIAGGIREKYVHDDPNMIVVGDGVNPLTKERVLQEGAKASERGGEKVAIILAHGDIRKRGTPDEHHAQGIWINENNESINSGSRVKAFASSIANNISLVMDAVHPNHIDIISCHSGAVKHDIKRNLQGY